MAFQFSKLLNESIEDSITEFCSPYCEPEKNQLGFCPTACIPYCYPTCYRAFLAAIPPLPPDLMTKTLDDDHDADKKQKSHLFLTICLAILVIAFTIFLCYTINKFCKAWYNSRREASELQPQDEGRDDFLDQELEPEVDHPIWYIRSVGLQPSVISSITIRKYKKGDGIVEGTDCAVCLNEFQEDETLKLLPKCNHAFHIPCIDKWLRSHTNCPMCRADIVINPVGLPSPVQHAGDSGVREEIPQEGVPENEREFEREREYESRESSIGNGAEDESQVQSAFKSNQDFKEELENSDSTEVEGLQPSRKSVSLDLSSASLVSTATANVNPAQSDENSDNQLSTLNESSVNVAINRVIDKSLSRIARNRLPEGSEQMKSSLPCCEKLFVS